MKARLLQRTRRTKASLAGMFYYLDVGEVVDVIRFDGDTARVSDIMDPSKRISEDVFSLPLSDFELIPEGPTQ